MADVVPSSLTRVEKIDWKISRPGWEWLVLFCASCHKEGGRVLKCDVPNASEFAFWLCDDCAQKWSLDGTYLVPDEIFFQKVREAMLEREGRELTLYELYEAEKDPTHYLSKLLKDRK
jgi:hypothetical protein